MESERLRQVLQQGDHSRIDCSILYPVWNGAKFIRESLPSVLNQEGVTAEIIISDDCSDDHSLDLVTEIVARYRGPHSIAVFRTADRAEIEHVPLLAAKARADLLIQAHQDDVSYPGRAKYLVEHVRPGIKLMASVADYRMDGKLVPMSAKDLDTARAARTFESYLYQNHGVMIGSRFAMHADLFRLFPPLTRAYLTGGYDILLPIRAAMIGEVMPIMRALLACGVHADQWSTRLWDKRNENTMRFDYSLRRLSVLNRALSELKSARQAGLVSEQRCGVIETWLTRAAQRFLKTLIECRERLVVDGFEAVWQTRS